MSSRAPPACFPPLTQLHIKSCCSSSLKYRLVFLLYCIAPNLLASISELIQQPITSDLCVQIYFPPVCSFTAIRTVFTKERGIRSCRSPCKTFQWILLTPSKRSMSLNRSTRPCIVETFLHHGLYFSSHSLLDSVFQLQ